MFVGEVMRAALDAHDVTLVYRLLYEGGVTQREIARRTGQLQSEVCDILKGRTVRDVMLLERIADGLSVSRAWMRLAGVADSGCWVCWALSWCGGHCRWRWSELHIEAGRYHRAVHHFMAALELATEARDAYLQSTALHYAGIATPWRYGHPNTGLKLLHLSLVTA